MHRFLLGLTPGDGIQADHIDGNKLDNRRGNLRACTHAQNQQNRHDAPHRGTYWHIQSGYWVARVQVDGERRTLGRFDTQEEAVAVVSAWRREHVPFSHDAREAA
jgi:hypothetical protein